MCTRKFLSEFPTGSFSFVNLVPANATSHTQTRCTQALKSQPHSQAHFILLVPHKIKRACLLPTLIQNKTES